MALTSQNLDSAATAVTLMEATRRGVFHRRRIADAATGRSRKWQSVAWLYAELKQLGDDRGARVAQAFAAQLNRGELPDLEETA